MITELDYTAFWSWCTTLDQFIGTLADDTAGQDWRGLVAAFNGVCQEWLIAADRVLAVVQLQQRSKLLQDWLSILTECYARCICQQSSVHQSMGRLLGELVDYIQHPLLLSVWFGVCHHRHLPAENRKSQIEHAINWDNVIEPWSLWLKRLATMGLPVTDLARVVVQQESVTTVMGHSAPLFFRLGQCCHSDQLMEHVVMYNQCIRAQYQIHLRNTYQQYSKWLYDSANRKNSYPTTATVEPQPMVSPATERVIETQPDSRATVLAEPEYLPFTISSPVLLPARTQAIFNKLMTQLEFIINFRGRITQFRTRRYQWQLQTVLSSQLKVEQQSQQILQVSVEWLRWISGHHDLGNDLVNVCVSLATALAVGVSYECD